MTSTHTQPAGGVLPDPIEYACIGGVSMAVYTADQMRAYGELCRATAPVPADPVAAKWTRIEECDLKYGECVMVLTTDADDEPCHELATFNGGALFLGYNAHRVDPVTHYQRLDAPPADWKLPTTRPKLRKNKRPAAPLHAEGGESHEPR